MRISTPLALVAAACAAGGALGAGCGGDGDDDSQPQLVLDGGGDGGDDDGGPLTELTLAGTRLGQSAAAVIGVSNTGARATGPLAIAISGAAANDFTLDNERTTCAGAALPPGERCEVAVVFRPRAAGERRATLAITSAPGGAAEVALIGPALAPSLVFSPAQLAFGRLEAGHLAQATIELRNEGAAAIPLDAIAVTGAGFSRGLSTCGAALPPGESCDLAIRLVPQALGPLAGSVVVTSGGEGFVAPLAGTGARKVTIAVAGAGAGTVTSAPSGIDCGQACEALFDTDAITLTAAPGASSALVGWSIPACGGSPTCAVPAQLEPLAITVSFALAGAGALDLVFAGGGSGEVQIEALGSGEPPVICFASCTVPLEPGSQYELTPATPSSFGGIAGACASATGACTFTAPLGASAATVTFAKDPKERWTRLPGTAPVRALAYDGSGNLIVAAAGLAKLSPAGATIWSLPLAGVHHVATGPAGTIYVLDTMLRKLDAAGAEQWARPLPAHAQGCTASGELDRCLAVGADGATAVRGTTGVTRWDAAGTQTWTRPVPAGPRAVAIDAAGVVYAAQDNGAFESIDVVRFAPDGSPLPLLEAYTAQYHAMLALDGAGQLMATSSGHSSVSLETAAFSQVLQTQDPDWVPTGLAGAGTGDVLWVYQPSELGWPAPPWTARRYSAAGALLWSLTRSGTAALLGPFGTLPLDLAAGPGGLAAGPGGELAVGGTYTGLTYTGGWIQTFAP
ncbi:MAG TPA: choice-of-anchor D domain-containing protein [Kofleriaceae bacterium]|nr:choice-of-anchor D domain-containing protein [Kofleriaceae bacterium]